MTTKANNKKKTVKYNVGDVLEVESFAGPKVYKKVLELEDRKTKWANGEVTHVKGCWGCFVRRKDLLALKKQSVPYSGKEKLNKTRSFTYDWQILRVVKRGK